MQFNAFEIAAAGAFDVCYLVVGFGVAIFLLVAVMPQFEEMFSAMDDVDMPGVTLLFIKIGNFMIDNGFILILGTVLLVFILYKTSGFTATYIPIIML